MIVTVITPFPHKETVVEYADFKEVIDKYIDKAATYEFPTGEQALTEIILVAHGFRAMRVEWRTRELIKKISKRITYRGVDLGGYFTWKGYVFMEMMGFYTLAGKMTK
jgi:hypothetical protein